jgi:hypothetical protein
LKAGEEDTCLLSLDKYYQFKAPSSDDIYVIKYSKSSMQLSNPFKPQGNKLESLESNELTVKIEVRSVPSRYLTDGNIRGLQTGSTIFYACTDTQKSIILQARKQALIESSSVVSHLTSIHQLGTTVDCPLHDEWFGTFDVTRFAELKNGYEELKNRLNDATIWFDCSCRKG